MYKGNTQKVIAGAVAGHSLATIAAETGLSRSTVYRRLREPQIRTEIERLCGEQREKSLAEYAKLRSRALSRLGDLISSDNEALALRAVGVVLNSSLSYERWSELEVRVREMERAAQSIDDAERLEW